MLGFTSLHGSAGKLPSCLQSIGELNHVLANHRAKVHYHLVISDLNRKDALIVFSSLGKKDGLSNCHFLCT